MSMRKVLVINNGPFFGGAERFIISTLQGLSNSFSLYYLVLDQTLASMLPKDRTYRFANNKLIDEYFVLKRVVAEVEPDILLFNGGSTFYLMPFFRHYIQILYRHSTDLYAPCSRRKFYKWIMSIAYRTADLTIHVSDYSYQEQRVKRDKGLCIHNGIQITPPITHKENSVFTVLFCGRLEESKGIIPIVNAFKQIPKEVARLRIVGTGSLTEWVKDNVCDTIEYFGFRNDVNEFYKETDALILMSQFENFPISILEAMSCSIPIITTGAGGIAEMVKDAYNGLIIPPTVLAIKSAVIKMASNRQETVDMGKRAYDLCCEQFDVEKKITEIQLAIETV